MTKKIQISCEKFTAMVVIDDKQTIVDGAPIIKKFIGQKLINLRNWAEKNFGETELIGLP